MLLRLGCLRLLQEQVDLTFSLRESNEELQQLMGAQATSTDISLQTGNEIPTVHNHNHHTSS